MPNGKCLLALALPMLLAAFAPAHAASSLLFPSLYGPCDQRNLVDDDMARVWTLHRLAYPQANHSSGRDANPAKVLDFLMPKLRFAIQHADSDYHGVHEMVDEVEFRLWQNVRHLKENKPSKFFEMTLFRDGIPVERYEFSRRPNELDSFRLSGEADRGGYRVILSPPDHWHMNQEYRGRIGLRDEIVLSFNRRANLTGIDVRRIISQGWGSRTIERSAWFTTAPWLAPKPKLLSTSVVDKEATIVDRN